jgi:hypothetical protein
MSASTNWYVGDVWNQTWTLTDPDTGDPIDPTTVRVTVLSPKERDEPGATGKPITPTKAESGRYTCAQKLTEDGDWEAICEVSGSAEGVRPKRIHCYPRRSG